ncbi:MAG: hypothetical protein B1H02_01550 [Candidatus Latescibacteria bacterium 4484_107]|nr:MAG: hypothetical protein B1H02_01550 [Candidatus Latescibacteria bacterium 4484_107]
MDENKKFTVSISPHIRDSVSIPKIMYSVIGALIPAWIAGIYFFGPRAAWLTLLSIAAAVGTEWIIQKLRKISITVGDGSAILTGMLLAFNLPPGVSWWIPVVGSAFAIGIGKQVFGGLGYNPMNPALLGRAFLLASWPVQMTTKWLAPRGGTLSGIDGVSSATPLTLLKEAHQVPDLLSSSYVDLFWGRVGGCLGETSAIMLLIGAAYLIYKGYVDWRIPSGYLGVVILLTGLFGGVPPLFHVLAGGLILGAFFMATDMVTSPITPKGKWIFGIGCGLLTVLIRRVGGYPEGVSYSILLMNLTVPLIDRFTRPKVFGG